MAEDFVRVADEKDVPPGALLQAKAGDEVLCLANIEGEVHAVGNRCPHARWPLANGWLEGDEIVCPGHGMLFNVANCTLNAYRVTSDEMLSFEVKVEDGGIWVGARK